MKLGTTKTDTHTHKLTFLWGLVALTASSLLLVPAFADFMKLGVGTSAVPHGGNGGGMIAVDGPDIDGEDGPTMQFTTDFDDYPLISIQPYQHDNMGIRFDAWFDPTKTGSARQRSSTAGAGFLMMKWDDEMRFRRGEAGGADQELTLNTMMVLDLDTGDIKFPEVTGHTVSGSALYIDTSTGKIGKTSSSKRYKENIRDLNPADTDWLYSLRPRRFDFKTPNGGKDEIGLIAEEVAEVLPQLVVFSAPEDSESSVDPAAEKVPDSVRYNQLIVPLVAEVQQLRKEVEALQAQLNQGGVAE